MTTLKELRVKSSEYRSASDDEASKLKETFKLILSAIKDDIDFKHFMRTQYSFVCAGLETELSNDFITKVSKGLKYSELIFTNGSVAYSVFEDNIFQTFSVDLLSFAIFHEGLITLEGV